MIDAEATWRVRLLDGTTEEAYGRLSVNNGVLWITYGGAYSGPPERQVAYPLTSVKKWERK